MMDWDDDYSSNEEEEDSCEDFSDENEWNENLESIDGYQLRKEKSKLLQLENCYLEEIAKAITDGDNDKCFFAEDEFRSTDITIEVEGIGLLSFPLEKNCIKKLIEISSKARFGKGEDTILDENVRDTHEIPGKKLKVTVCEKSLSKSLDNVRSSMKLAENCVFRTELHNMLIYGPGQFFKLHQDSEKATNMVGSLVIIIPSPHIGGDLVIQHSSNEHIFSSEHLETEDFKCIYFYADCKHKVEKVKQGYRVALTYKLILQPLGDAGLERAVNQNLKIAIQNYFSNWNSKKPAKLIFFLDHSYTKQSLKWHLLKGLDQLHGDALLKVAKELGLTPYLVLVEIHHNWFNGDDDQMSRIVDVLLNEVDYDISYFIDCKGKKPKLPFDKCSVNHSEICWTKETSASFKPESTDLEGFTGNEGLSLDYWYKRAGVILWPKDTEVQMGFLENKETNLCKLQVKIASPGNENEVKETVKVCGKFICPKYYEKSDFDFLVDIALYIKDEDLSLILLSDLKYTILNDDVSDSLYKLESQYGVVWCINMLRKWQVNPENFQFSGNGKVLEKINVIVESYLGCGGSPQIVEMILEEQMDKIFPKEEKTDIRFYNYRTAEELLNQRMENAYKFFLSCAVSQNSLFAEKAVKYIDSLSSLYNAVNLTEVYLKIKKETSPANLVACEPLKNYLQTIISAIIVTGKKDKNDWSISESINCECTVCTSINDFLHSKVKQNKLKITQKVENHIESKLGGLDLPIKVSATGKKPKMLTLTKTERLHKDAQKKLSDMKTYLKQLQS